MHYAFNDSACNVRAAEPGSSQKYAKNGSSTLDTMRLYADRTRKVMNKSLGHGKIQMQYWAMLFGKKRLYTTGKAHVAACDR